MENDIYREESEMENRPNYFAVIPAFVRHDNSISTSARLLYGEIAALCNAKGYCWASNQYFADLYEKSTRAVSKWVSELSDAGHIKVIIYRDANSGTTCRKIYIIDHLINGVGDIKNPEEKAQPDGLRSRSPLTTKIPTKTEPSCIDDEMVAYNKKSNNKVNTPLIEEYAGVKRMSKSSNPKTPQSLVSPKKSNSKGKDIMTMRSMIDNFSQDLDIRLWLLEYFNSRLKKGLNPKQWDIILEDLRNFSRMDKGLIIEKVRGAIAGGYMQIIASWEKDKGRKKSPDNLGGESKVWKSKKEQSDYFSEREQKYIDEFGELEKF